MHPRLRNGLAAIAFTAALSGGVAFAADEVFVTDGVAILGYDPVAYHTAGAPTQGSAEFTADYDGVTWRFASAENRDLFAANPARYAPAYGGWCATGTSFAKKIPIQPEFFKVVDGTLYLNSGEGPHNRFLGDEDGTISRADTNWTEIENTPRSEL